MCYCELSSTGMLKYFTVSGNEFLISYAQLIMIDMELEVMNSSDIECLIAPRKTFFSGARDKINDIIKLK